MKFTDLGFKFINKKMKQQNYNKLK